MTTDIKIFNRNLTEWLIEYNFRRPHQTLDYKPPMGKKVPDPFMNCYRCTLLVQSLDTKSGHDIILPLIL